jgi:hypothetical protein
MAITRSQQAKQMLRKGGRIGFQGGGKDSSTIGTDNFKAREYSPSEEKDQRKTAELNQRIRESERGQTQTANQQAATNRAKAEAEAKEKRKNFIKDYIKDRQKLAFNIAGLIPGQKKRSARYQKAYKDYLESMGVTPPDTLTGEEDDLADFFVNNAFDKPVAADANVQPPQSYGDFLLERFGAPGVKFSGNVGGKEVYVKGTRPDGSKIYDVREIRGGEGDNSILPIAQPVVSEPEEIAGYVNPLSLLTPRIAGTRFLGTEFEEEDDTEFAADGGRIGFKGGADMGTVADSKGNVGAKSASVSASGDVRTSRTRGPDDFDDRGSNVQNAVQAAIRAGVSPRQINRITNPSAIDKIKGSRFNNPLTRGILRTGLYSLNPSLAGIDFRKAVQAKNLYDYTMDQINNPVNEEDLTLGLITDTQKKVIDAQGNMGKATGAFNPDDTFNAAKGVFNEETGTYSLDDKGEKKFFSEDRPAEPMTREEFDNYVKEKGYATGGIASLDREAFIFGGIAKGLKKAVRGVKKLVKSPIGKIALGAAAFQFGGGLGGIMDKFNSLSKLQKFGIGVGVPSILAGLMTPKQDDDEFDLASYYAQNQLTPSQSIRGMGSEFDFYGGQRMRVADGGDVEPVAKKTMPLLDMDGKEKDYRETGGFVDMGRMERADDVPARLSKNEFVFTADAVRNAGEGNIDKGAEVMYNMMKNLEAGGEVSEESQGLEGAREMFQTSQRLGEVI